MSSAALTKTTAGAGIVDWQTATDHVRVFLKDVEIDLSVGLHPWEQHPQRPTRLLINVEMFAVWPLPDGGFINYDHLRNLISGWQGRDHVDLLETLAEELVSGCFALDHVAACRVRVEKPQVFNEAAGAGIELFRKKPS